MRFARLLAVAIIVAKIGYGQVQLVGTRVGSVLDFYTAHPVLTGDTPAAIQTAATYASGASAGTSTLNRNDGAGNVSISGTILGVVNDGTNSVGTQGNILVYKITVLDMTSAANTTVVDVNVMAGYGTGGNLPAGWNSACTVSDARLCDWKSGKPISVGGWIVLPVFRQERGAQGIFYAGSDSTLIGSPDGGLYWINPYNYRRFTVSNVACAAGVVTLTTSTNTFAGGGGDVIWVHGALAGSNANGKFTTTSASATSVSYSATCATTGASSGFAGPMSATGDAPLPPADASYTANPSSMMWKDVTPFDGSSNFMGRVMFFDYCQDNACTGSPHNADTYLYGFGGTGRATAYGLFRVPKNIDSIMDVTAYQYYTCAGYSPSSVCDGLVGGNWTATLANRTMMLTGTGGALAGNGSSTNPGAGGTTTQGYANQYGILYGSPTYYTANGSSAYFMLAAQVHLSNGLIRNNMFSFPTPWGPFTPPDREFTNAIWPFFNPLRFTLSTPDSSPYHARFIMIADNNAFSSNGTLYFQSYDLTLGGNQSGTNLSGCTPYRFAWSPVTGAIIRRGLYAFFDMFSHGCYDNRVGNSFFSGIWANDTSSYPSSKLLLGCYTDAGVKCGNPNGSHGPQWVGDGMRTTGSPYLERFELRDQAPGIYTPITATHPFATSADPEFTASFVIYPTSIATASQALIDIGPADHSFRLFSPLTTAGTLTAYWSIPTSASVQATTNAAVLANTTWAYVTVAKTPGAVTVCATVPCAKSSATVHLYVNGAEVATTRTGTGTPSMQAGTLNIATYLNGVSFAGTHGAVELYSRALDLNEIKHNYAVHKTRLFNRGITFASLGNLTWSGLTNGQWTALTDGQWTSMTN